MALPDVTNRSRFVFEEDDAFGLSLDALKPAPATVAPRRDFLSKHSDLGSLNLAAPVSRASEITATCLSGHPVLLKERQKGKGNAHAVETLSEAASRMLSTPFHRLKADIEDEHRASSKDRAADAENPMMEGTSTAVDTDMWTDKYRPTSFTDLLGDEVYLHAPTSSTSMLTRRLKRLHRSALLWLKSWDNVVFSNDPNRVNASAALKKERRLKRAWSGSSAADPAPLDPYNRPAEKVLLLSGPPGLGKTTLAHVLAKQAGYVPFEINASDDRTGKVVEDRIRNAMESQILGQRAGKQRPTCVILDECDGGTGGEGGFIKTLVRLIQEGSKPPSAYNNKKTKAKKERPVLRPIICICNDLYAPTLRPLRPLAKIIRFAPPTHAMLARRLRTICEAEEIKADGKHLTLLAELADGDLRNCLNTLQVSVTLLVYLSATLTRVNPKFIKRKTSVISADVIQTATQNKDTGTSATTVVHRLFNKPPLRKGKDSSDDRFVDRLTRDVQTCGEYDKISQGCFENYLGAKQFNDSLERADKALEWLAYYDRLDAKMKVDHDYELLAYVPHAFVPWYKLFSSHTAKPLEFPKVDYEQHLKRLAHQEIADAVRVALPHTLKTLFTGPNLTAELLPILNRIVSPDLRPLNSQLINADERQVLMRLVNVMLAMQLNFVPDKNEDGQLILKLDPPIDVFVHFDGKRASDIPASRFAVRQMVATEMEAEYLRRLSGADASKSSASDILAAYKSNKPHQDPQGKPDVKDAVDFFGRVIVPKAVDPSDVAEEVQVETKKRRVMAVYKFHEGFSNAVRVTKRVSDFLV